MRNQRAWLAFFVILNFSIPLPLRAGEPTEKIRFAVDQGIQILKNSKKSKGSDIGTKNGRKDTIDQLRKIVYPLFDFTEMAKRSLGSHWRRRTQEEKLEFVNLFTSLLEISYANRIDLYKGQSVKFTREELDDDYARVESMIFDKKKQKFSVGYKLLRRDGRDWRIYDVVVENISLINNYRSQFHRVITNKSYSELLKRMKEKIQ